MSRGFSSFPLVTIKQVDFIKYNPLANPRDGILINLDFLIPSHIWWIVQTQAMISVHVNLRTRLDLRINDGRLGLLASNVFNLDPIFLFAVIRLKPASAGKNFILYAALKKRVMLFY
jgi:hypothetical protein